MFLPEWLAHVRLFEILSEVQALGLELQIVEISMACAVRRAPGSSGRGDVE